MEWSCQLLGNGSSDILQPMQHVVITSGSKTKITVLSKSKDFRGVVYSDSFSFSETSVQFLISLGNGSIFSGYKDSLILGWKAALLFYLIRQLYGTCLVCMHAHVCMSVSH